MKPPADDLRFYTSHPNPVADYAEAVRRVESKFACEVDFDPGSHTILLTHGARTAKAIVFVHGYPSIPSPFKEIAAKFYDRGYNVLVMTMLNDSSVDNIVTDQVVDLWRTRWAKDVQTYQFPADLGLGHDIIDAKDSNMNVGGVYPKLLGLIDQWAQLVGK